MSNTSVVLPTSALQITSHPDNMARRRGIYNFETYTSRITFTGEIVHVTPDLGRLDIQTKIVANRLSFRESDQEFFDERGTQ
jgi:inner membrane protein involved in colicin E2 resistance